MLNFKMIAFKLDAARLAELPAEEALRQNGDKPDKLIELIRLAGRPQVRVKLRQALESWNIARSDLAMIEVPGEKFEVMEREVTVRLVRLFMEETGYYSKITNFWAKPKADIFKLLADPAQQDQAFTRISHYDARPFIDWLNKRANEKYRLPTRAELEILSEKVKSKLRDLHWEWSADVNNATLPISYDLVDLSSGKVCWRYHFDRDTGEYALRLVKEKTA